MFGFGGDASVCQSNCNVLRDTTTDVLELSLFSLTQISNQQFSKSWHRRFNICVKIKRLGLDHTDKRCLNRRAADAPSPAGAERLNRTDPSPCDPRRTHEHNGAEPGPSPTPSNVPQSVGLCVWQERGQMISGCSEFVSFVNDPTYPE